MESSIPPNAYYCRKQCIRRSFSIRKPCWWIGMGKLQVPICWTESGPHGIVTSPAGVFGAGHLHQQNLQVSLIMIHLPDNDPKGMGGDVFVFKQCLLPTACPTEIIGIDQTICSGDFYQS